MTISDITEEKIYNAKKALIAQMFLLKDNHVATYTLNPTGNCQIGSLAYIQFLFRKLQENKIEFGDFVTYMKNKDIWTKNQLHIELDLNFYNQYFENEIKPHFSNHRLLKYTNTHTKTSMVSIWLER